MTEKKRKQHSAEYKFKIALEAAKENKTLSQLASEQEVHPNQISQWKRSWWKKERVCSSAMEKGRRHRKRQRERII